jgi:hypothetical protein
MVLSQPSLINTVKKSTEALLHASKEVGLEASIETANYMAVSRHRNAGQNRNLMIAFENVAKFQCLGTTETNQNCIQEETKKRLNSGNVCYYSVQNSLSSVSSLKLLRLKYTKPQFYLFLYGRET